MLAALAVWFWRENGSAPGELYARMMHWLEGRRLEAAIWLILLQAALVILAIPGPFFTVAAGFLFGMAGGLPVALAGSTLGAVAAYGIARKVPAEGMRSRIRASRRLSALERFMRRGGWTVVLSTRLIPFFPFKLSNYFFGLVRFPFAPFFWGTLVGIAPITLVSVAAGAVASDVTALLHAESPMSPARWIGSLAGLAVALALLAYAARRARAEFRDSMPDAGGNP